MREISLPICKKCQRIQIKILRHPCEICIDCNSEIEAIKFKEVKENAIKRNINRKY